MSQSHRMLTIALCLAALTFLVDSTSAAAFKRVHAGESAPAFTLPDLEGNPVNLEDYKEGPLTILVFWALWSPKSPPLLGDVQKLVDEFGEKGLKGLAVNAEGQNAAADHEAQVKTFVEEHSLKFPILLDPDLEQYNQWGVIATPSTAFLGKDLAVTYEFSGHPTSAYEDMREQVMKALGIEEEVAEAAKPKRERYKASKRVMLNYGLARTQFQRGQFAKASRKLKKVLAEDPEFPDAYALHGAVHLGLERGGKATATEIARESFQKAVELDDTLPLGLAGQAHFALIDGDLPKAMELTRRAVEYTEPDEMPVLGSASEPEGEGTEGAQPAAADAPETSTGTETVKGDETALTVTQTLDNAAAALEAGDTEKARSLTEQVVEAILDISEGPKMKAAGLEMMQKMNKE